MVEQSTDISGKEVKDGSTMHIHTHIQLCGQHPPPSKPKKIKTTMEATNWRGIDEAMAILQNLKESIPTKWCHHFNNYLVQYWRHTMLFSWFWQWLGTARRHARSDRLYVPAQQTMRELGSVCYNTHVQVFYPMWASTGKTEAAYSQHCFISTTYRIKQCYVNLLLFHQYVYIHVYTNFKNQRD